jgi:hypothetical protein
VEVLDAAVIHGCRALGGAVVDLEDGQAVAAEIAREGILGKSGGRDERLEIAAGLPRRARRAVSLPPSSMSREDCGLSLSLFPVSMRQMPRLTDPGQSIRHRAQSRRRRW